MVAIFVCFGSLVSPGWSQTCVAEVTLDSFYCLNLSSAGVTGPCHHQPRYFKLYILKCIPLKERSTECNILNLVNGHIGVTLFSVLFLFVFCGEWGCECVMLMSVQRCVYI